MANESQTHENDQQQSGESHSRAVDAVRHVGPTLEAEEAQVYVPAREEASAEDLADDAGLHIHRVSQKDGGVAREREEPASGEPLRTRLAGDTSSDPHTDIKP